MADMTPEAKARAHFHEHLFEWLRSGHEGQVAVYSGKTGEALIFADSEVAAREMFPGHPIFVFKIENPGADAAVG